MTRIVKVKRPQPPQQRATVPGAEDMEDEVLFKHLNARHQRDLGLNTVIEYSPLYSESLINTHRRFHKRCHELESPGQYDHEHVGEN